MLTQNTVAGRIQFSRRGTLAQLVEQRTFNPLVAGSNPARPTKEYFAKATLFNRVAFCFSRNLFITQTRNPFFWKS
jgi:hypothetical protein